jgi:solute carrier family 66 (lysosomal lysine-arginine transporter), member 1
VILAFYYTIADLVLLAQCFYYRGFTWRDDPVPPPPKPRSLPNGDPNERTSLINPHHSPILRERRGSDWSGLSPAVPHIPETPPPPPATAFQTILWNTFAVLMVVAAGILGWFLGQKAIRKHDDGPSKGGDDSLELNVLGQFFGWLCAASYIASRLPQLILNWRRKTTDGLSMLFFLFACLGNITYALSIFAYEPHCKGSCAPGEAGRIYGKYMLVNLSWLAGALITLLLDLGVFIQYFIYNKAGRTDDDYPGNGYHDDYPGIDDDHWDRPILDRHDSH